MDLSGSRPRTTAEISAAVKAKQRPVHHLTDLDVYFKTAEFVGLEAAVYREEENWQELFRVLLAYTSLVVETIRKHKDWTTDASRDRRRAETCGAYEAEVVKCMEEMESLKPRINAAARAFAEAAPPERPAARPPPVDGAAATTTTPKERLRRLPSRPSRRETGTALRDAGAARGDGRATTTRAVSPSARRRARGQPRAEYVAAGAAAGTGAKHALVGTSSNEPQERSDPPTRASEVRNRRRPAATPVDATRACAGRPSGHHGRPRRRRGRRRGPSAPPSRRRRRRRRRRPPRGLWPPRR